MSVLYGLLMVMPASCWLLHEPQRVIQQSKARCWDDSKRTERFQKSNGQQCGKSDSKVVHHNVFPGLALAPLDLPAPGNRLCLPRSS